MKYETTIYYSRYGCFSEYDILENSLMKDGLVA